MTSYKQLHIFGKISWCETAYQNLAISEILSDILTTINLLKYKKLNMNIK